MFAGTGVWSCLLHLDSIPCYQKFDEPDIVFNSDILDTSLMFIRFVSIEKSLKLVERSQYF